MSARRKLFVFPAAGLVATLLWISFGSFHVASGKEEPVVIARAHDGAFAPRFDKPIFILLLGGDARRGNPERTRTDSIHILGIDPVRMRASLLGIPRDSFVDIAGRGQNRINTATFFGGPDLMIRTVESISACRFDYYTLTSFAPFVRLIDAFGGITFKVPKRLFEDCCSHIDLFPGTQKLDGKQTLALARDRHHFPKGDFDRSLNHGKLMIAALREARGDYAQKPGTALRNLAALRRTLRMDIPLAEGLRLGLLALRMKPENVSSAVVDGTLGSEGDSSIVHITQRGLNQLADICADGILDQT